MDELLKFFIKNEKNEGNILFNYFKIRISLVEKNMMRFINSSAKSEGFLQKIIINNNIYLDDNLRNEYFKSLLLNLRRSNYYHHVMKYITIDRFKANEFIEKYNEKKVPDIQLNETIFGQLYHLYENAKGKEFLLDKRQRLFEVNLRGERAIDQGGPYQEIISCICIELQSDYIELFIKTPNNKNDLGDLKDKYIVNPDSNKINQKKAYEFIGKIMGLAISTGDTINLNLHPIILKSLLENRIEFEEYETIDCTFFKLINDLEEALKNKDLAQYDLNFVIKNSNKTDVELIENGEKTKVTLENLDKFIIMAKSTRMNETNTQIEYIKNGLYSVIDKNILQILSYKQLEEMICGKAIFDIIGFKKNTECQIDDKIIKWFWEWLENCKEEDKFKYLKFVSGRSRLPSSDYKHSINRINEKNRLPVSHTCSFALDLPEYDSKKILIEKMEYAIQNIVNITDS